VPADRLADLRANLRAAPHAVIGRFQAGDAVVFRRGRSAVCTTTLGACERAWKRPLDLDGTLVPEARR